MKIAVHHPRQLVAPAPECAPMKLHIFKRATGAPRRAGPHEANRELSLNLVSDITLVVAPLAFERVIPRQHAVSREECLLG